MKCRHSPQSHPIAVRPPGDLQAPAEESLQGIGLETLSPNLTTCVLVSLGCHNRVPQTGWLKQQIFSYILEAESPTSSCRQG